MHQHRREETATGVAPPVQGTTPATAAAGIVNRDTTTIGTPPNAVPMAAFYGDSGRR
jgi:hypothetical protein